MSRFMVVISALMAAMPGAVLASTACRLGLMLALDVSASVDGREYALQTGGVAAAMLSPEVAGALLASPDQPVWLSVFEWSGPGEQAIILPWHPIRNQNDLTDAAEKIGAHQRRTTAGRTAIGAALGFAGRLFSKGPDCATLTLDVSGDGANNVGPDTASARGGQGLERVTINALAIGGMLPLDVEPFAPYRGRLRDYFQAQVLKGPAAFVISAETYDDYADAMRRKLFREVSGMMLSEAR